MSSATGTGTRHAIPSAYVAASAVSMTHSVRLSDFALQIPDVSFPFNVSGGASKYQKKKLAFGFLELSIDAVKHLHRRHKLPEPIVRHLADAGVLEPVLLHPTRNIPAPDWRLPGPVLSPEQATAAESLRGKIAAASFSR